MAAGSGSRYGKLKQFDDLGPAGEFLMEFSIFDALKNGFNHIVVITKQENQEFLQKHLSERIDSSVQLDVLVQKIEDIPSGIDIPNKRKKPWRTAHAVWTARDVIKTPFVIINADDYYGEKAFEALKKRSPTAQSIIKSLPESAFIPIVEPKIINEEVIEEKSNEIKPAKPITQE